MNQRHATLKAIALAITIGTAGIVSAQATDGSIAGTANQGDLIIVRGDNGFEREVRIEKDGKFSVRHLPVGTYQVIHLDAEGNPVNSQTTQVSVGKTSRVM